MPDFSGWSARIKVPHLFFMINYVQVCGGGAEESGIQGASRRKWVMTFVFHTLARPFTPKTLRRHQTPAPH